MTQPPAPLILLCSPRAGGASDTAARLFAAGLKAVGAAPRVLALRGHAIAACEGCGACARPPHACPLAAGGKDGAEKLLSALEAAPLALLAAPMYFYHLPAQFKALVDRAQSRWAARTAARAGGRPPRPALFLATAGRVRGERLFDGAVLTLKYFLEPLGLDLRGTRLLRGLDGADGLLARPAQTASLEAWGRDWGRALC